MEKLNRAQKCSIFGSQNLGSMGAQAPVPPYPTWIRTCRNTATFSHISILKFTDSVQAWQVDFPPVKLVKFGVTFFTDKSQYYYVLHNVLLNVLHKKVRHHAGKHSYRFLSGTATNVRTTAMESSKNAEYKKCERMNFFEKMAMIEPRIDAKTKRNKVANKNFTKPPEESKMYSSARKVKQKFLVERVASLSPNSSPRSQSRSPSPSVSSHVSDQSTESNATLRVAEFRNPNLSVIQGSAKLERINVDEFDKSPLSSHQFSSVTDTVKNISNEDKLITSETIIDDEFNTPMSSEPVSVKSSNKLSTQTTSGNLASLTHIKTSEMTQMKENDRSSPKRFNTAHPISASQEENVELRKSPFVYLEIMQKEMIDKHMSSPSSSLKTNEKKQQVPSRAKLKDIAKCSPRSSPRSSPKLVKKPFRRSSLKSVSDSQVENALPTKNAKTPTKCSAVSPIKNETTLSKSGPSDDLVITSKEPTNTLLAKFTQPDDTSSTHSSVDQEIVQIIPRFAVESDHKNEHDLCGRVNKTNNGEDTQV